MYFFHTPSVTSALASISCYQFSWTPPNEKDIMVNELLRKTCFIGQLLAENDVYGRYYRMFEATQDGLGRNAPIHSIHGSLLAVGELLR